MSMAIWILFGTVVLACLSYGLYRLMKGFDEWLFVIDDWFEEEHGEETSRNKRGE